MRCSCVSNIFQTTLHYTAPGHGGWGVLKAAQLIPESYHLFISPAACGRHGALGARLEGRKNRVSYVYLTEQAIVSGDYEDILINAVDEMIRYLKEQGRMPKVFVVFVSCIDDLLGTDHDALVHELSNRHEGIRFVFCKMNPTSSDTSIPPIVNVHNKIHSVLDKQDEHDSGVNLIGILEAVNPGSELFEVLKDMGVCAVRHISYYNSFAAFQDMAKSSVNFVLAPPGKYASKNMQKKLGIPYKELYICFRMENIYKGYKVIEETLGKRLPDLSVYERNAIKEIKKTKELIGNTGLIVDGEAIIRPFEFAHMLIENGFFVKSIYAQRLIPCDTEDYEWIVNNHPEIAIYQPLSPSTCNMGKKENDCIAIGYSAGYLSGAEHVVDICGQNGLFGYHGVSCMMKLIRDAYNSKADLKKILDDAVIIV